MTARAGALNAGIAMIEIGEPAQLAAARAGDREAFDRLTAPYRRALLVHCYRMLGSLQDAEDLVQETLLRAWQHLDGFEERSSLRSWLYAIATNGCLNALERRRRRTLPVSASPAANPREPWALSNDGDRWLEPLPDHLLADIETSPEARYTLQESVGLAFLTALQRLTPRQRAVLLLREVLAWHAAEVAQLLNLTVPMVNGLLHRARATLNTLRATGAIGGDQPIRGDATNQHLLDRYMRAWETADVAGLLSLLTEEATLAMPPSPSWYRGREAIGTFVASYLFSDDAAFAGPAQGRWRLRQTRANGLPAFGVYLRDEVGSYQAVGVSVIVPAGEQIADMISFLTPALVPLFALAPTIEA